MRFTIVAVDVSDFFDVVKVLERGVSPKPVQPDPPPGPLNTLRNDARS